jgi:seryl-tRNA synthetase
MLDIKYIRENPEEVKKACIKKHVNFDVDELLKVDQKRSSLIQEIENVRRLKNEANEEMKKNPDKREEIIKKMKELNSSNQEKELQETEERFKELMLLVPNIPHESVPEGKSDEENLEVKKNGNIPEFNFKPKDHIKIAKDLDLIDFERGTKVAGFRGYFLKNEAAQLCFAIWQLALEKLTKTGFRPIIAPSLVKESALIGTGWLPQQRDEVYKTDDDMYLCGTAEVALMDLHSGETLKEEELPLKYVGFSPCFRTEIGSYGKNTKGIYRVHEFFKLEQVILGKNDKEETEKLHEEITNNAEEILQALEIPYRVVVNCAGDLGLGQVKKYDIEAWIPSQEKYGETHSASYFYDFQTRRLNIKYKTKEGETKYAYSLNTRSIT